VPEDDASVSSDDGGDDDEPLVGALPAKGALFSGLRRDMLIALGGYGGSYLGICMMLDRLADDLEQNRTFIPVTKMLQALRSDESAFILLHCIPTDLLASIIRGTVAYDFRRDGRKPRRYSKKTGGTYVAGLSISGRLGKFLSGREMERLAANIDKYIKAYDDFVMNGDTWDAGSAVSREQKRFVASVDNVYGKASRDESPRFIRNPVNRESTTALAAMFRRRMGTVPDMTEYHIQSPLMVGCNGAAKTLIEDRVAAHYPQSGLVATTRTWALTLCLLSYMGITPVVTTVAVLPTWETKHLPVSERIVTALAQSLVTQDGFNVDQPGNHTDRRSRTSLQTSRQMVMATQSWFRENLAKSVTHMNHELKLLNLLEAIRQKGPKPHLNVALDCCRRNVKELEKMGCHLALGEEKLRELLFRTQRKLAQWNESEKLLQDSNKCLEEILMVIRAKKQGSPGT
jgi:hypothetical protein